MRTWLWRSVRVVKVLFQLRTWSVYRSDVTKQHWVHSNMFSL